MSAQDSPPTRVNQLADATSPYLLQHSNNPVDWHPWCKEALERARREDKPIFLSIGYAACHWCHVMAHESFEDEGIAALLNKHFVSIKVDREERPDLDEIYMMAVQMMTGSGGWPMSVFLTPELRPFYGGTYFPPDDRYGRPGFRAVLKALAHAWENRREEVLTSGAELANLIEKHGAGPSGPRGSLHAALLDEAVQQLAATYDSAHGGFGGAPKFPSAPVVSVLFRQARSCGDADAGNMAAHTLDAMACGGIYDHLGGGFHRYSVDEAWLVPHFEKMLYDNAQLAEAYLEGFQVTQAPHYRRVAAETLGYLLRDMRHELGGFFSSEDADSEGGEGAFYVWSYNELEEILGAADMAVFAEAYSIGQQGNFPASEPVHAGANILHMTRPLDNGRDQRLRPMREKVFDVRAKRPRPGLDDKILCSWNGLAISAFAKAHAVLGDEIWRQAAVEAARFVLDHMRKDGRLLRSWRRGVAHTEAYLEDYAFMSNALVDLYEASFDVTWLDAAEELLETMMDVFWDNDGGGFFFTAAGHDDVLVRTKTSTDGAVPSGNSVAALTLLRLGKLLDKPGYIEKAEAILQLNAEGMSRMPHGFPKMLCALDFFLHPGTEAAIVGPRDAEEVEGFLKTLHRRYIPNKIVAFMDPSEADADELARRLPLLAGKSTVNGSPAAYVCKDYECRRPSMTPEDFEHALEITTGNKEPI